MSLPVKQSIVVEQTEVGPGMVSKLALFNPDGTPFTGGGSTPAWNPDLSGVSTTAAATPTATASPNAVAAVGTEPTKAEYDAVVTLANELKTDLNATVTLVTELKGDLNALINALKA